MILLKGLLISNITIAITSQTSIVTTCLTPIIIYMYAWRIKYSYYLNCEYNISVINMGEVSHRHSLFPNLFVATNNKSSVIYVITEM